MNLCFLTDTPHAGRRGSALHLARSKPRLGATKAEFAFISLGGGGEEGRAGDDHLGSEFKELGQKGSMRLNGRTCFPWSCSLGGSSPPSF